ncbi:MAG: DUF1549 domain-containing protein [Planctomycetes bacterium]|nr:DUF1549 domain-containing protein [Planctomycetota bacterium]
MIENSSRRGHHHGPQAGASRPRKVFADMLSAILITALGAPAGPIDFNRDIRPILTAHCVACHGPDEKNRKADLRLDRADLAKIATSGGHLAVPGKPLESEIVSRVRDTRRDKVMPPPRHGKPLSPLEISLLEQWVAQGAKAAAHWAFVPPARPPVPMPRDASRLRNPIDAFLLSRLDREKLAFSPEADKPTLLRRASLDLTGLQPTPGELEAFLADSRPDAYERQIDRLLASPRYGERMALEWLDLARYADSNGFQTDSSRQMWPWRDWVIRAFNANIPFDRFTMEQVAGDMLPGATRDQVVATGFQRNHRLNGEGGLIAEEWRIETVIDRVETTSLTWLGLTAGCARCHDHKYDPLSQKEFYGLFAIFNNVPESGTLASNRPGGNSDPVIEVPGDGHEAELARLNAALEKALAAAAASASTIPGQMKAWEEAEKARIGKAVWTGLDGEKVSAEKGSRYTRQADGTWLATGGNNPPRETTSITSRLSPGPLGGILLECLPDASLPQSSLGRFSNGNFVLTRLEAELTNPAGTKTPIRLARAEADYSQNGWPIEATVKGDASKGWAVDGPTRKQPVRAMFLPEAAVEVPADSTLVIRLVQQTLDRHNIGRFRVSLCRMDPSRASLKGESLGAEARLALSTEPSKRTVAQQKALEAAFKAQAVGPLAQADRAVAAAAKAIESFKNTMPTVMVMREGPPKPTHLLIRGEYDRKGELVQPSFPSMLPNPGAKPDRLAFARWLVSAENPLPARVWVNRAWERFFGIGLSRDTGNLGTQAEFPAHPELLDWLAVEFRECGWDMKRMQRLMLTSAAFRQSARVSPELLARDPENRLLARGPRFRLTGEVLRDQALFAGGLLVEKTGGPSARPYMPEGVWDETSRYGDLRGYKHDKGDGLYRRSLYTVWKRTAAPPTMLLFDAPSREVCSVRRGRTNTPLQALALLNEVTFVEAARGLAERMAGAGGDARSRLSLGVRLALARPATGRELDILESGLRDDLSRCRADAKAAASLASAGDKPARPGLDPAEVAAYTLAANVLLNLDEFVTRE